MIEYFQDALFSIIGDYNIETDESGELPKHIWPLVLKVCPNEFYEDGNDWAVFATKVFIYGANMKNWVFRDESDISLGMFHFLSRINSDKSKLVRLEQKIALGAWLMYSLLEYIPVDSNIRKAN